MSRVISGDYGGVFGLEQPRRVCRDRGGDVVPVEFAGTIVKEFIGLFSL